jgi:cation transport ATPase
MLVHYCAPAAVELGHAVRSLSEGKAADMSCLIAAAASLALFASAFRTLFFTSIYFHPAAEIIAASLVVLLLFCLPALYLLRRAPALLGHRS